MIGCWQANWFGKLAKYAEEHNISASALIALVLAGVMRPATILSLPGKEDKEDKIYAAGHAIASGIIGFLVSTAVTSHLMYLYVKYLMIRILEVKNLKQLMIKLMS